MALPLFEMKTHWDYSLVALSVLTAVVGSYIALHCAAALRLAKGGQRLVYTGLGASVMGLSIWSMHFIGMMALVMPMSMTYDPLLSFLSMAAAVIGAGIAFAIVQRPVVQKDQLVLGGLTMGLAISTMHYTGMASMEMAARVVYEPLLFVLSLVVAIVASFGALWLAFLPSLGDTRRIVLQKISSALVMGVAISGMHYTAMTAAHYYNSLPLAAGSSISTVGPWKLDELLISAAVLLGIALFVLSAFSFAEQQRILEQLRANEERYRLVAQGSNDALLDWDLVNDRVYWSERFYEIAGVPPQKEPLTQEKTWLFFHPDDRSVATQAMVAHLENNEKFHLPIRVLYGEGDVRFVLLRAEVVRNEQGRPVRMAGAMTDVTEHRQAQHALKEYAAKLEQSNQELEQFAAIASHDLQAPLRKVIMFSDALREAAGDNLSEECQDYIQRMQRAITRMQALINDLLMLSRVTRKGTPFQPVDLQDVLNEAIEELEVVLHEHSGSIQVLDELPLVDADARQLQQVFLNLIGNALKFHKPNVPPIVTVRAETDNHHCKIKITDNGIGFKSEYSARIFRVFERLQGEAYPGTGIGLAIVQKIIERHNGAITATGTPDYGATFTIILPLHQDYESLNRVSASPAMAVL